MSSKRFPIILTGRYNRSHSVTVWAVEERPSQWTISRRQVLRAQREVRLASGDYLAPKHYFLTMSDLGPQGAQFNVV